MEELTLSEVKEPSCSKCDTPISLETIFCAECGYPENGTEQDVAKFHANNVMQKNQHMDADKKIKSARNVLYVMAGIFLLVGFFNFFNDQDAAVLVSSVIIGVIYLTTIIISAIFEPATILKGIIFKILIIAYLGKGVYSASSIKK